MRWTTMIVGGWMGLAGLAGCIDNADKKPAASSTAAAPAPAAAPKAEAPTPATAPTPAPAPAAAATEPRWTGDGISWIAPKGWTTQAGEGLRFASVRSGGGPEIAVTRFPGLVGGLEANVNRWRNQVGLPPAADRAAIDKDLKDIKIDGHDAWLVELKGPDAKMLAVMLPEEDKERMWFFKMMGGESEIEAQRAAFMQWVGTVRVSK